MGFHHIHKQPIWYQLLHEALLEFTEMGGWKARNALFQDRAEQIHDCFEVALIFQP